MLNKIAYYDVCIDCGSQEIVIEDNRSDETMITLWCRNCGTEWNDYIEDVRSELR